MASVIQRIRGKIQQGQYVITQHAYLEMGDDRLEWEDVKQALLNGKVRRKEVNLRGTKYVVVGQSRGQEIGVVGRFAENHRFLIITIYKI
jgi:hypothetical protein